MPHILAETLWLLFITQINAAAWFDLSCFIGSLWAFENWRIRL